MKELQKFTLLILFLFISISLKSQTFPVPTGLRVESSACGEVTLAWDDYSQNITENAFNVYRSESENGIYVQVATVYNVFFLKNDTGLEVGKTYYYKLKGVFNNFNNFSDFSSVISQPMVCPIPNGLSVLKNDCGSITLKLDTPTNSSILYYSIYRSESINGTFQQNGSFIESMREYTDNAIEFDKAYFYKVKAIYNNISSDFGNAVSGQSICPMNAPILRIESLNCRVIKLNWDDFPPEIKEDNFKIYISENENGPFTQLSYTSRNVLEYTYFESSLMPNKNYYFKITAAISNSRNWYYTDFSNTVIVNFTCPTIQNFHISNEDCDQITIKWDNFVSGFDFNEVAVFRSPKAANQFQYIGRTNKENLEYKDFSIQDYPNNFRDYDYKILGYGYFGIRITEESNIVTGKLNCVPVTGLQISTSNCDGATLSWDDLSEGHNETGFEIFYSDNPNKDFIALASVSANTLQYNFTNPYPWVKNHFFKVRAAYSNRSSDFSNVVNTNLSADLQTVKSGNWWDPEVWSCGHVPKLADFATINTSHNIILISETAKVQNIVLNGSLQIENGFKLKLESADTPQNEYEGCCGLSPLEFTLNNGHVYVPNVFTPNGDGINDLFYPIKDSNILEVQGFTIISAIGDTVLFNRSSFNYSDIQNYAWDGNRYTSNQLFISEYNGIFKYGFRIIEAGGYLKIIEGYACVKRCTPDAAIFEDKNGCYYPNQGTNLGTLDKTKPNLEPGCN